MFWNQRWRQRALDADNWGELEEIAQVVAASLDVVEPNPIFGLALRDRLMLAASGEIARRMEAEGRYSPVRRGVLVGAGAAAAVSLAGAMLVFWRRSHPDAFNGLLNARSA